MQLKLMVLNKHHKQYNQYILSILFIILFFLSFRFTIFGATGIYETINFQAKIVELDGTNSQASCGNTCNFNFRIYDASSGGTLLWSETQNNVSVQNGIINVKLGSSNPFGTSIDFNDDSLYLEIAMDADDTGGTFEEVFDNPRLRFSAVPYSFNSKSLGGLEESDFLHSKESDTFEGQNDQTLNIESDLSSGNRTSEVLKILQQNDATNIMSSALVSIEQQDGDSTGDVVFVENLGSGNSLQVDDESLDSTPFVIDNNGNVGIQNSTPNASLDVSNGTTSNNILNLQDDSTDVFSVLDGGNIVFYNNEAEQFRLENLGAAPTCDASTVGRQYYDTSDDKGYICVELPGSVYEWFNFTSRVDSTVDPTVDEDAGDGYAVGTVWVNTLDDKIFILVDNTTGSAIWTEVIKSSAIPVFVLGEFYDSAGGQDLNLATPVAISWNQEVRKDSGITHNNTINNSRVYMDEAGWYRVDYSISHENQSNNRKKNIRCRVRLNGSNYVTPSDSYSFSFDNVDEWATNSTSLIFETTSGDEYYEVMCNGEGEDVGVSAANTISNQSWTQIEKIGGSTLASQATLDNVYYNDGDKVMNIEDVDGLEFASSSTGNVVFDLQSTGDFVLQDNDTDFLTIADNGGFDYSLDNVDNPSFTITNEGTGSIRFNDEVSDTSPVVIDSSGKLGIGTTTPNSELHVEGNARITSLASCDLIYSDADGDLQCGTGQGFVWDGYDNAGGQDLDNQPTVINIDTERQSNSNYTLANDEVTVNSDGLYEVTFDFGIDQTGGNTETNGAVWLQVDTGTGFSDVDASTCYVYSEDGNNGENSCGRTVVLDLNSGDDIRLQAIRESGGQGVLTTISGGTSLTIQKVLAAGADLAEIYYTNDEGVEAGDVLAIDGTIEAGVRKSKMEYENSLIGVVSTKPAKVIGNDGGIKEGRPVLVALSGRVPVKVVSDSKPIEVGDYVTSSDTSGFAMKADKPGIVIGKALERWDPDKGDDTVMIFVGTAFYDPNDGMVYQDLLPSDIAEYDEAEGEYVGGINIGSKEKSFNNVYANQYHSDSTTIGNRNLSEKYKVMNDSISAGDVVAPIYGSGIILDKTKYSYQSSVIGVVSSNPGITLSDLIEEEDQVDKMRPVALAGRVPVKVTTENGPIEKGDRLVPSSKAGYAMKQCGEKTCKPSIIIGIALEDFDENTSGDSEEVSSELKVREKILMEEIEELKDQKNSELQENLYSYGNGFNKVDDTIKEDIEEIEKVEKVVDQLTKPIEEVEQTNLGEGRVMMFVNLTYVGALEEHEIGFLNQVSTVMGDNIQGSLSGDEIQGNILGNITVGELLVLGDAVFEGDVEMKGAVLFNEDTVGRAVIKSGDKLIKIKFQNQYVYEPIITVTPIDFVGKYKVLDISKDGFSIQLERSYRFDVWFNWHSFSSWGVNTSYSESDQENSTGSENKEVVIIDSETTTIKQDQDTDKQLSQTSSSTVGSELDARTKGEEESNLQAGPETIIFDKKKELEVISNDSDVEDENKNLFKSDEETQIDETSTTNEIVESYAEEQSDDVEVVE
ncbi:hypothetical protein GF362_05360 [Candidatus Dojkabacteria bacterium]|nr:hypothetical protein [Candidatus Dojkabacteria bacterium]